MPSSYEETARREILAWKNRDGGFFGKLARIVNWPLERAGDAVLKIPGIGWVIERSVAGLVGLANDLAQWTVRAEKIYDEYRRAGHGTVREPGHIGCLDLEHVDRRIGWLAAKYKALTLAEGAGLGFTGPIGIAPDVVLLVTMNLRAIGEYATYCGFDVSSQHERLFAMNVLGLASSPTDASKTVAMAQLAKIAQDVARKRAWKDLEQHAFVQMMQQIAKSLGVRLTKAKVAEFVPVAGAAVGGGFNAYFTGKVCDAAYYLYRERFLAEKYGPEFIAHSDAGAPQREAAAG
jgi:hypothetical protein